MLPAPLTANTGTQPRHGEGPLTTIDEFHHSILSCSAHHMEITHVFHKPFSYPSLGRWLRASTVPSRSVRRWNARDPCRRAGRQGSRAPLQGRASQLLRMRTYIAAPISPRNRPTTEAP
jgi:hypothetical protein